MSSKPDLVINNTPNNFIGGKAGFHLSTWKSITSDSWILSQIEGVFPEFDSPPHQEKPPQPITWSNTEKLALALEIESLKNQQVISETKNHQENEILSNIFLRRKPNGTYRAILNLKPLNQFVHYTHFQMNSLNDAMYLVKEGYFFTSVDLKDAYYTLPLHVDAKKYFRFLFDSTLYEFNVLVMGYSDAPLIFTKVMKPALSFLRDRGVMIVMYIDDALIVSPTEKQCQIDTTVTLTLFDRLGFTINKEKSCLQPTQEITYLGFLLNSKTLSIRPTQQKRDDIIHACNLTLRHTEVTIRALAELIGKLVAISPGNKYGPVFVKRLEIAKNAALRRHKGNFDEAIELTPDMINDISWWTNNVSSHAKPMFPLRPQLTIYSDASNSGWGGTCNGVRTNGLWSSAEKQLHINCLELKAAFLVLQAFTKDRGSCVIDLFSDNTTTVVCINKMGSTKVQCNAITRNLWLWCISRNIWVKALHLPGSDNIAADKESRTTGLETEWSLDSTVFDNLNFLFGPFDVDLFASRINHKLPSYVSWKKDAMAWKIDAFSIRWSNIYSYVFPPFRLILRCLQKIDLEEADCVIIIPVWKSQVWFTKLISLLVDVPVLLPRKSNLLHHPLQTDNAHPILSHSHLAACRLSGKSFKVQAFQRTLSTLSSPPGVPAHDANTPSTCGSGLCFVLNNKKIPFRRLHKLC